MMEKMTGESLDLTQENIKRLKELFPEVLTEKKIDFNKLRLILGDEVETSPERYEFRWNGKNEAIKLSQTPSMGTLRPDKESSKNWDTTENLYIEGDNLEVLKLLQKSYFGKIKMIYIDPPYNTGKDFVYKDNFQDNIANYKEMTNQSTKANPETNGRYHTDWLNMIYPRLKLARNLLREDGVIFISLDDNEISNLKKVCDEIFGEDNFVTSINVIVKTEGRRYGYFAKTHENLLVYCKRIDSLQLNEIEIEGREFSYQDEIGGFNLQDLRNQNARAFNAKNRPNLRYPFYVDEKNPSENGFYNICMERKEGYTEVFPITVNENESVWRWGREKAKNEINNLVARKGSDGVIRIFQKYRKLTQTAKTVWSETSFISNKGTKELQELLGMGVFDFPKPLNLIKRIIEIGSEEESIILDFFSGSATTAHALMKLNADNGGSRKFIMVQLPEKVDATNHNYENICEIGKERIRRAGNKVLGESNNKCLDIGFKVFKLDDSNIKTWDPYTKNLENTIFNSTKNIKDDRSQEDLLYELMLKMGIELTAKIEEVSVNGKVIYNIQSGGLVICLEDEITKEVINYIPTLKSPYMDMKVVFKEYGFKSDADKMNAIQNLKQYGIKDVRSV